MIRTLLVPGYRGSEPEHWQRLWAIDDPEAGVVEQDDWHRPHLSEWLHRLESYLVATPGVVLVAHSLGCILVAHLAQRPAAAHVAGALLVAPADVDFLAKHDRLFGEFDGALDHPLPFRSTVVASRNDPFMTFARAKRHAEAWGSALVDLGPAGHINVASGFGQWPDGPILADGVRSTRPCSSAPRAASSPSHPHQPRLPRPTNPWTFRAGLADAAE
ncbi:alpha/beta hydrolase [Jiella sp. MQZ9-1]|uniref:Alpha/beta hydrolase n=1 Tax=Jiella flava TaxID=2816857 RepID=A0A939FYA9_9HYPH|nr:alpha/beta hydrolase [Jiella flava]MBO0662441.1 alpha/beta hydrolase [Jiella flava]MCD2471665.1 alpha/beta hydrolase [Jiella flava]